MNLKSTPLSLPLVFLILAFSWGCSAKGSVLEELKIREAAYRYEFDHAKANMIFISDEEDALLKKFSSEGLPVKPGSHSARDKYLFVVDKQTGTRGLALSVEVVKRSWFTNIAVVRTTRYRAPEDREGYDLELKKENGIWVVKSAVMVFVS